MYCCCTSLRCHKHDQYLLTNQGINEGRDGNCYGPSQFQRCGSYGFLSVCKLKSDGSWKLYSYSEYYFRGYFSFLFNSFNRHGHFLILWYTLHNPNSARALDSRKITKIVKSHDLHEREVCYKLNLLLLNSILRYLRYWE